MKMLIEFNESNLPITPTQGLLARINHPFQVWDSGWFRNGEVVQSANGETIAIDEIGYFIPCAIINFQTWNNLINVLHKTFGESAKVMKENIANAVFSNEVLIDAWSEIMEGMTNNE